MQKNEFEKQVQQKMEELKVHPSDSVWLNIEASIAKTKRRRRVWIFLPALLICLLCGGYFYGIPKWCQSRSTTKNIQKMQSMRKAHTIMTVTT